MKKQIRLISLILCAALILSVMLSAIFVITHINHDCTGNVCEICHQISLCEQLLKKNGLAAAACAQTALSVCFFMLPLSESLSHRSDETLVGMKVKLSC